MLLSPADYEKASVYDLLVAAARGQVGMDHRWLRAILKHGPGAAADLLAFLTREREDDIFDLHEDVLAIARTLASPEMLPVLVELARRNLNDIPELLGDAFRQAGPSALEPLIQLRRQATDPIEIDGILASLGVRDPRIFEFLIEDLERDRLSAAVLLSIYGDPAAQPALQAALAKAANGIERREILDAIESLQTGEQTPEPLAQYDIWAKYPETALPEFEHLSLEELLQLTHSAESSWRIGAVRELAARNEPGSRERILQLAREDPDPHVRGESWRALRRSKVAAQYREEMLARMRDPSLHTQERCGILIGLCEQAEDAAVRRWILEFYDSPETRAVALEAMKFSADPHFAPYVQQHLDDEDVEIRRQAILAAAALGMRAELGRLRKHFSDPRVRKEALVAYATLAPVGEARFEVRRLVGKIEQMAGGLSNEEASLLWLALNQRFVGFGQGPLADLAEEEDEGRQRGRGTAKVGRNDPCPCGSGKIFKKCCGA